jgi:hypothetical protein
MLNSASGRGDVARVPDHDEGVGMDGGLDFDENSKELTSVPSSGVISERVGIGNGVTVHSRNSSAGDSDFVSMPGDLDVNGINSRIRPTTTPVCDHSGSDRKEHVNDARDYGPNPFVNHCRIRSWPEAVEVGLHSSVDGSSCLLS